MIPGRKRNFCTLVTCWIKKRKLSSDNTIEHFFYFFPKGNSQPISNPGIGVTMDQAFWRESYNKFAKSILRLTCDRKIVGNSIFYRKNHSMQSNQAIGRCFLIQMPHSRHCKQLATRSSFMCGIKTRPIRIFKSQRSRLLMKLLPAKIARKFMQRQEMNFNEKDRQNYNVFWIWTLNCALNYFRWQCYWL